MSWRSILGLERKAASLSEDGPAGLLVDYPESRSGPTVNWRSTLTVTTALRCVQVKANGFAQVPLKLYTPREDGGSDPATGHDLYFVLYRRPNPWQTSFEFRQTLVYHRELTGNFFAFKNVVGGRIVELIPFEPGSVEVIRNRDMSRTYRVRGNDGGTRDFPQEAIWHLKGPSWCGWNGDLPAVRLAREAIGLALSSESSQSTLHRNGLQTTGVYSVTGNLSQEKYQMLRAWIERQALPENRFRPMLLDLDAKFTPTTMKGVDAEHLATRKMQIEEVCRAFGVFPQMVGHGGDQAPTFASAEQFFIAHVVHTLMPLYQDVEQSIDVNLIGKDDPTFAKFTVDGLMRGAMVDRFNAYAQALGSGGSPAWMTPNEVRGLQEMNPLEGGDELPKPAAAAPAPAKPEGGGNGSS